MHMTYLKVEKKDTGLELEMGEQGRIPLDNQCDVCSLPPRIFRDVSYWTTLDLG